MRKRRAVDPNLLKAIPRRGVFITLSNTQDGAFCEIIKRLKAVNYLWKTLHSRCLTGSEYSLASSLIGWLVKAVMFITLYTLFLLEHWGSDLRKFKKHPKNLLRLRHYASNRNSLWKRERKKKVNVWLGVSDRRQPCCQSEKKER